MQSSHISPLQCSGHVHEQQVVGDSTQVPPFRQGFISHGPTIYYLTLFCASISSLVVYQSNFRIVVYNYLYTRACSNRTLRPAALDLLLKASTKDHLQGQSYSREIRCSIFYYIFPIAVRIYFVLVRVVYISLHRGWVQII